MPNNHHLSLPIIPQEVYLLQLGYCTVVCMALYCCIVLHLQKDCNTIQQQQQTRCNGVLYCCTICQRGDTYTLSALSRGLSCCIGVVIMQQPEPQEQPGPDGHCAICTKKPASERPLFVQVYKLLREYLTRGYLSCYNVLVQGKRPITNQFKTQILGGYRNG